MNWTTAELTRRERSLRAAGRDADADAVARTLELYAETDEWIACLRCGMAFPTADAHRAHYSKQHPYRYSGR